MPGFRAGAAALSFQGPKSCPKRAAATSSCRKIAAGQRAAPFASWSRNIPRAQLRSGPIPSSISPAVRATLRPWRSTGSSTADFIRDRDIYVVSQRGTMFSEPALTCVAPDAFARELLGLRFYSEATMRAHLAATEACRRDLAATGADLSAYNSTESAADFADLRKVLGYDAWNVYGTSYGSYTGAGRSCATTPEGIRSVVLNSVLPTTYNVAANWQNASDGFANIFRACGAEPACNAAHPHLEETFTGLCQQARGRAADGNRQRPGHRRRHQSRHRRRSTDRLAAQPELWRAHAPSGA